MTNDNRDMQDNAGAAAIVLAYAVSPPRARDRAARDQAARIASLSARLADLAQDVRRVCTVQTGLLVKAG